MENAILVTRPSEEDMQSVVDLINAYYKKSYEFIPETKENFRKFSEVRSATVLVAKMGSSLLGVIISYPTHWGGNIETLATDPARSRETADLLIKEIESLQGTGNLYSWVDPDLMDLADWRKRGFVPQFCWYHMVAPLREPMPIPATSCNAVLRELRTNEEADMVEMVNKSFGRERLKVGCIRKWKEEYGNFDENWIHIADVEGKIASLTVSAPDRKYNEYFSEKRGYLGPAATLPEFRCKNLGTALNAKAMNFLLAKGFNSVSLYTDSLNVASSRLLRKLNFKICHIWTQMTKHLKTANP